MTKFMSEDFDKKPWYFQNMQTEAASKVIKLASERPTAPVIYSETLGYIEVDPSVVSYLSEPGAIGMTGAMFGLDSNFTPGLKAKALEFLLTKGFIKNNADASRLRITWAGKAQEAAARLKK